MEGGENKSFPDTFFFFPFKEKKNPTHRSCTNQDIEDCLLVLALQYRKQFAYYVCLFVCFISSVKSSTEES